MKGKKITESEKTTGVNYRRLRYMADHPAGITMVEFQGLVKGLGLKEEEFMGLIRKAM